jgi:TolB protein
MPTTAGGEKVPFLYFSINTIDIDGSNELKLVEVRTTIFSHPQYTPDGSKIIYSGDGIWIMDTNGNNRKRLIEEGNFPHIAPDGSKIVHLKYDESIRPSNIWIINVDGSNDIQITDEHHCYEPRFSPDGLKIAYVSDGILCIMDSDGNNKIQLTKDVFWCTPFLNFSPDGTKIVYSAYLRNRQSDFPSDDIYIIDTDGSHQSNLTNNEFWNKQAQFSPDGRKIAYVCDQVTTIDIIIMNIDGSDKVDLIQSEGAEWFPVFSPDGTKIAFHRGEGLHILERDGNTLTFLTSAADVDDSFSFSPNGNKIVFVKHRLGD